MARHRIGSHALVALALLASGACASPPPPATGPMTITICGRVESVEERAEAGGSSTWLTVRDSRSGESFVFLIRPEKRGRFEAALGATPAEAYRGASLCASGYPRSSADTKRFELDTPEDVRVNRAGK